MEELARIVKQLIDIENKGSVGRSKRVRILQKLNEKLLSEYYIKINDNFIIEPLLVEAYYYHGGKFEDGNTHQRKKQKSDTEDRFGKLYFHEIGYGGIDVCLSTGEYYLSFLIKNALIHNQLTKEKVFRTQTELYVDLEELRKKDEGIENRKVLVRRNISDNQVIFHTVRTGLEKTLKKETDPLKRERKIAFMYENLAAVKFKDSKDGEFYGVTLEGGYKKEIIAAQYIHEYQKYSPEIDRKKMSKDLIGVKLNKIWEEFD